MARIPLPVIQPSLLSGAQTSPAAPTTAFGNTGLDAVSQGLGNIAQGLVANTRTRKEIEEASKEKEDKLWLSKARSEYIRKVADFETNPDNRGSEYLPRFLEASDEAYRTTSETAPSAEIADEFEAWTRSTTDRKYPTAASYQAEFEMKEDLATLNKSWNSTLGVYHKVSAQDPEAAAQDLLNALMDETGTITELYGAVSPSLADELVGSRAKETILALAPKSPGLAKDMIQMYAEYFDEATKEALTKKMERQQQDISLLAVDEFNKLREERIIAAQNGEVPMFLSAEDYQTIYPGERGLVEKKRDERKLLSFQEANAFIGELKGLRPDVQFEKASAYLKKMKSPEQITAYNNIVAKFLAQSSRAYEHDKVSWLLNNNDIVGQLLEEATMLEDHTPEDEGNPLLPPKEGEDLTDEKIAYEGSMQTAWKNYYDTLLSYQGPPPKDAKNPEAYMNLPLRDRHVLTQNQATTYAAQINGGSINKAVETINGILSLYPTDELRAQAIKDLTTLPADGIRPEIKIAFQNAGAPWLDDFIGSVRSMKDMRQISDTQKNEIKNVLQADPTWISFYQSVIGPQKQRSGEIAGYYNAIETYAQAKIAGGVSPEDAVHSAIEEILTTTMAPVTVNRPEVTKFHADTDDPILWLPREINGRVLHQEEIDNLGWVVGNMLSRINWTDVDPGQFAWAPKKKLYDIINDSIINTGTFYLEPGGKALRLMIEDQSGQYVDLRNKDGGFFRLPLDKLPNWKRPDRWETGIDSVERRERMMKEGYDLWNVVGDNPALPGNTQFWEFTKQ